MICPFLLPTMTQANKSTVTSFRQGYLAATSRRSRDVESLTLGDYDALIFTSSWDARSVALTGATKTNSELGIVLLFSSRDRQGFRDKHDAEIQSFMKSVSGRSVAGHRFLV